MRPDSLEIETKYDVPADFVVPDLTGVDGVATADAPVEHALEAQYFDAPDLRLARARVTLRRRTGGSDDGWHLKLPASGDARWELHAPLGRAVKRPPKAVVAPVTGLLRGSAVAPVASLRTRRVVTVLRDEAGRPLAEVADDTVSATALTGDGGVAELQTWREVEVELLDGGAELLGPVGERLVEAGARRTGRASKLARALGLPSGEEGDAGRRKPRAGKVVVAALAGQLQALQDADVALRMRSDDAARRMRLAARRLRSLLAAFRPVLDRGATDPLGTELAWLGERLSEVRDDEIAYAHLRAAVAELPAELVLGPVAARLQPAEVAAREAVRDRALEIVVDARYLRLLDALHALLADPPLTADAGRKAGKVLDAVLRHEAGRVHRAVRRAERRTGPERTAALHAVRRAARRTRHTAEAAVPVLGASADDVARAAKKVQRQLGALQDAVVVGERCRRLAVSAHGAGESAFTYGLLLGREEARAADAERGFATRWPELAARLPS
ncbi:CYTH and CHAD domain-containing protein [Blastococcus sp. TF02A-30]|uniref:CYTH and CHAD domain-containing protein n=1 Tax=Blastococcus sp. TF02A-30 TaxID=2250580 RepID=UPI000DE96F4D|nr:CYTH and CHAD domain-containing protein [Blastococcus sp. TF02A-30]RBY92608.1 metal-chelation protein CHAD [Blastococcus sp. TF02A-30]